MFEGLLHQLLIGILSSYIKTIQKDHLRSDLWEGVILLENVALVLEAFDYLQLPFAIKKGEVGKLSIKIPWKKFGLEPILIALEDVFICTCRRNNSEWSAEAVEAREWAGKKAKPAASGLAKLLRRVCDIVQSYILAKIIDNSQLKIKNFHIRYVYHMPDLEALFSCGLRFSTLSIITADARAFNSSARSTAGGKLKDGQVHKHVEIRDIGLYWNSSEKYSNIDLFIDSPPDITEFNYILKPLHVSLSLMVSKSGKFESGSPKYAVSLDFDDLVLTLDDIQIYQMLMVRDDFSIYRIREKYGQFRPWSLPISNRTGVGWQRYYWQYAVDAVLSDVRKKMHHVSWTYFESRMATRIKYIRLYGLKLEHLHQDQHLDDDNLHELEEIEKELDVDEILNYRSVAESFLQIKDMYMKENGLERAASRIQTWLNWLSLGMLGAGGTTDSRQCAGVISDDIIEDIHRATKYNSDSTMDGGSVPKCHCYLSISIDARKVMAKLDSMSKKTTIMCMTICGAAMTYCILQDSAHLSITFSSMEIIDPFTNHLPFSFVLRDKASADSNVVTLSEDKSCQSCVQFSTIEVEMLPQGSDADLFVSVMIEPFDFIYNEIILENIIDFLHMPTSFQGHLDRVLSSLNGFENIEARILSKAEYIFSNRNRIFIDANLHNAVIIFPWHNAESSWSKMVFSMESVHLGSLLGPSVSREKFELEKFRALAKNLAHNSIVDKEEDLVMLGIFYDCFEIKLDGVKGRLESPMILPDVAFIEFDASATINTCILKDEPAMKQLKVHGNSASMHISLSYSILKAFKDIGANLLFKHHESKNEHRKVFPKMESMHQNPKLQGSRSDLQSSLLTRQICASDMHKVVQYETIFGFKSTFIELSFDEEDQVFQENLTLHARIENFDVRYVQGESGCNFRIGIEKIEWSCNAPIMEIFIRHICICTTWNSGTMEASFSSEMQINYHNIYKVVWEPFVEPWSIQCQFVRKIGSEDLLNISPTTNIDIKCSSLNLNLTEALTQAVVRGIEIIKDIKCGKRSGECPGNHRNEEYSPLNNTRIRRYAPYFLQNDTGMPLNFWLIHGPIFSENNDSMNGAVRSGVEPGFSAPLFVEETAEEISQRWRPNHSSERLADRKTLGTHHHMICVQLEGTSEASMPMSMDLVGLRSFQVDFSKNYRKAKKYEEKHLSPGISQEEEIANDIDSNLKLIFPVVFEVSMKRYSKLVRLYSTVILVNATSVSLEVRLDIPFGIAPKVMDPILPGQELPLPVHLAETGQMRWRPLGSSYLWSEAHSLTNILSQENKLRLLRSFVCYPSHPSNGPFRCCISIQENAIRCHDGLENQRNGKHFSGSGLNDSKFTSKNTSTSSIRRITLTAPLVVKNCLPACIELSIETGAGVMEHVFVSEGDVVSVFDIDFVHELGIEIHVIGFAPSFLKFAPATVYTAAGGTTVSHAEKNLLTETLILSPDSSRGRPVLVRVEKAVDPLCGSRELSLFVPFWIYNCSGMMLEVRDGDMDQKVDENTLCPSYSSIRQEELTSHPSGIGISCLDFLGTEGIENGNTFKEGICYPNRHVPCKIRSHLPCHRFVSVPNKFPQSSCVVFSSVSSFKEKHEREKRGNNMSFSHINDVKAELDGRGDSKIPKVQACMYSPARGLRAAELTLRLGLSQSFVNQTEEYVWSDPFPLNPPSGSCMVVIPQPFSSGAFIISAVSSTILGACKGRTMAITFQPRYVISNACSQDLCYKQRGTNSFQRLKVGEHFDLHWTDVKRELLVSIRFDERGWDWSGSFLPDKLGDTQVKVRNYVTGALKMVRIEVQNASIAVGEGESVNDSDGNLGTYLVLLSDDDTGFMPYRIDNFSMEILRFYQKKCENFENILQPYASCAYAWDEPCQPQRLRIEVPGKGFLGSYGLDDVRNHVPVRLSATSKKLETRFLVSVHAEGPIKVLSVTSADTHTSERSNVTGMYRFGEKHTAEQSVEKHMEFSEKITVSLPFIGLAIVDSFPQELAFSSVRGVKIQISQGLHRQKIFLQVASFQIDNQLPHPVYPVLISIEKSSSGVLAIQRNIKENLFDYKVEESAVGTDEVLQDAAFSLSVVKWRCKGTSVNCFECVAARFAPLRLEFEDQMVLRLVDFIKSVTSIYWRRTIQTQNFEMGPLNCGMDQVKDNFADPQSVEFIKNPHSSQLQFLKVMKIMENHRRWSSPAAVRPIGAPWQSISLLARRKRKVYIEIFHVAPIKLTISFSSSSWLPNDDHKTAAQSLMWINSTTLQRSLMALMDVEGAPVYFQELTLAHPLASWDAIRGMAARHYTRQFLHEVYKVLGSVGVFGNPMGFVRSLGFGIRNFISVPARSIVQNPTGLAASMAQGTRSLLNNTVFAVSNAATQFSKAARKGVAAFTFDDEFFEKMERWHHGQGYHNQGVLNGFLEGLTGLLQSPIRGAEKHGLPGMLLGIATGAAGLVARPVVSILEVSARTAQSIRDCSNPQQLNRFRVRFPRPVIRDSPLRPYSLEEAVGTAVLQEVEGNRLKDEVFVTCIALGMPGTFIVVTERLLLKATSASLAAAALNEDVIPTGPDWDIHLEIALNDIIHFDREGWLLNVLACISETRFKRPKDLRISKQNYVRQLFPFTKQSIEFRDEDVAENFLHLLQVLINKPNNHKCWVSRLTRGARPVGCPVNSSVVQILQG